MIESRPLCIPVPPKEWLDENIKEWEARKSDDNMSMWGLNYDMYNSRLGRSLMNRCCNMCHLEFNNQRDTLRHMDTWEHQCLLSDKLGLLRPPNPLKCELCDIAFRTEGMKRRHMISRKHKDRENHPEFSCDVCRTHYKSRRNLLKHIRISKTHKARVNYLERENSRKSGTQR